MEVTLYPILPQPEVDNCTYIFPNILIDSWEDSFNNKFKSFEKCTKPKLLVKNWSTLKP